MNRPISVEPDDAAPRCAALSRLLDEPQYGTASRVRRWILIEQPGAWGRDALRQSKLDAALAASIAAQAGELGARVLLIRRPRRGAGASLAADTRTVMLAHTTNQTRWIRRFDTDPDLTTIDFSLVTSPTAPTTGVDPGPVVLVCTNGRHDACCADYGRPVVRELITHADLADSVWESSHVGGDRFAANVVHFPTAVYHGRVPPADAADLVRSLNAGRLDISLLRGRSFLPPLVQVSEVHLRQALDEPTIDALSLHSADGDRDQVTVNWQHSEHRYAVRVHREHGDAMMMTCGGSPSEPWRYVLDSIEPQP